MNLIQKLLPASTYKKLKFWLWANTDWVSNKSYSNEGEDMILRRIFFKKANGFYIDIGAFHPKKSSNTYNLYKKGWNGINIDAMPGSMKLFNRLRKRDFNLEVPLGKDGEMINYYEFEDRSLNGFESPDLISKDYEKPQNKLIKIHQLRCKSLNSILEKFLPKGQQIDLITIDVEGQEYKVLEFFDFKKYRPKWIIAEIWDLKLDGNDGLVDGLLRSNGYLPKAKTLNTVFYHLNHG